MAKPTRFKGRSLLLALFVALILADFFLLGGITPIEHPLQDLLVRINSVDRVADPDVVVVDVDDASLLAAQKEQGVAWPWPRSMYADMLNGLMKQGPKAVVFDIFFVDPDNLRPEGDRYLIQTAVPNGKVYFPAVRLEGADDSKATSGLKDYPPQFGIDPRPGADPEARAAMMFPLPELALTGRVGVVNFLQDADKVGRRYYLYYDAYGWGLPSLPTKVAMGLGYTLPPGFLRAQLAWARGRRAPCAVLRAVYRSAAP